MAIASTQQVAAAPAVHRAAPSATARAASRDDAHSPNRISPGNTTGTSRWLAHGCSGSTAGSHSTVTTDQQMITKGKPHRRTVSNELRLSAEPQPSTAPPTKRHASNAAPATASSTAGTPRYHSTQFTLD